MATVDQMMFFFWVSVTCSGSDVPLKHWKSNHYMVQNS